MSTCMHGDSAERTARDECPVCGTGPPSVDPLRDLPRTVAVAMPTATAPAPEPGRSGSGPTRPGTGVAGRSRLGAGLVEVPPVPRRDPADALMIDPKVPITDRFCSHCGAGVGRDRDGRPSEPEGTCAVCGTGFSFSPKLSAGDLVGGQYEVLGCLAYGGLGWIYLARDRNVSDRWVVLKGLLDAGDRVATAAALAERRVLAEVEHPNIVKIYNFVQHPDPHTGRMIGYIVMEYLGGRSLRELALAHEPHGERLPLRQVLAYGLEILPALGYLHSIGLLFCDVKPDNLIQTEEQLTLVDFGATRRSDAMFSPVFCTIGYAAPELERSGPSIRSDLYSLGRTLAVLSFRFRGHRSKYRYQLPEPADVPVFAAYESYYRLLCRATHQDPARRFDSAEEMAEQLLGVLREVVAAETGEPCPGRSAVFAPERRTFGATLGPPAEMVRGVLAPPEPVAVATALPVPQVNPADPAAAFLATASAADPDELLDNLLAAPVDTVEVRLRRARARLELRDLDGAEEELRALADPREPDAEPDWRVSWQRALLELAAGRPEQALTIFDAAADSWPGEPAPKLGLAACAELVGEHQRAARNYESVWRTDHDYVSAAFGLARVRLAEHDPMGALRVLDEVPDNSSRHVTAQISAIVVRTGQGGDEVSEADLLDAGERLDQLSLDVERRTRLMVEVLRAALDRVLAGRPTASDSVLLGHRMREGELRLALERCYRVLARFAVRARERIALVDKANTVRPRTLW